MDETKPQFELRKYIESLIGDSCFFCEKKVEEGKTSCGRNRRIHFHEMHGIEHECNLQYYLEHYKDFMPLCTKHHRMMHELMRARGKKVRKVIWSYLDISANVHIRFWT